MDFNNFFMIYNNKYYVIIYDLIDNNFKYEKFTNENIAIKYYSENINEQQNNELKINDYSEVFKYCINKNNNKYIIYTKVMFRSNLWNIIGFYSYMYYMNYYDESEKIMVPTILSVLFNFNKLDFDNSENNKEFYYILNKNLSENNKIYFDIININDLNKINKNNYYMENIFKINESKYLKESDNYYEVNFRDSIKYKIIE